MKVMHIRLANAVGSGLPMKQATALRPKEYNPKMLPAIIRDTVSNLTGKGFKRM